MAMTTRDGEPIIDLDEAEQGRFWSDAWQDDPDDAPMDPAVASGAGSRPLGHWTPRPPLFGFWRAVRV